MPSNGNPEADPRRSLPLAWQDSAAWGVSLLILYALALLFPAAALACRATDDDSLLDLLGRGTGLAGFTALALQVVLGSRPRLLDRAFGLDRVMRFHRRTAIAGGALLLGHPIFLALDEQSLRLFTNEPPWNIQLGKAALGLMALVILTAVGWRWLRVDYRHWRFLHKGAFFVVLLGFVHAWRSGTSLQGYPEVRVFVLALGGAACACFLFRNLWFPFFGRRRFRVASLRAETADAVTLALEPQDGKPLAHRPGQFLFLTLVAPGFPREEHPFTIASSPLAGLQVTVKSLGDFTRRVREIPLGSLALVEGPFGRFSFLHPNPPRLILIAGGVGITPLMSMLRFLRDSGDGRPAVLLCGNRSTDQILFRPELAAMGEAVRVVHVLSSPEPGWEGERGYVTPELIQRHAGPLLADAHAYVCGPPAMMRQVIRHLRGLGLPRRRIHAERFAL